MNRLLIGFVIILATFSSCNLLEQAGNSDSTDIVEGLKTALEVGTDTAVAITSMTDGYLKDELIKISLPPEADIIVDNISYVPGGQQLLDNVITGINRSAEDAAKSAGPIFKNAITSLTIDDGLTILNGQNPASATKSYAQFDSTAATQYLKSTTYDQLVEAFSAPINQSLGKPLVLGISTTQAWNDLTSAYNEVVNSYVGTYVLGLHEVNTDLGEYCTQKALDGLFLKVGNEEIKIRRDPWQWISTAVGSILTKVFGGQ